jgi:hypothetical protein
MSANTTGSLNTAVGRHSLNDNIDGGDNVAVGKKAGTLSVHDTNMTFLGSFTANSGCVACINSTAIGYGTLVTASNTAVIGNDSVTDAYFGSTAGNAILHGKADGLTGLPHVVHLSQSSGTVLTTGTKPFQKVKYAGSIVGWTLTCTPSCSITVDLLRSADAGGIPTVSMIGTGTKPAIASGLENKVTTAPSDWTSTAITAYDNLAISLSGITAATQVSLDLYYQ